MSVGRGVRNLLTLGTVTGTAVELAWLAAHVASYPFGVVQERARDTDDHFSMGDLSPVHRGLLIGARAYYALPVRQYPKLDNTVISITTPYPGAPIMDRAFEFGIDAETKVQFVPSNFQRSLR